MDKKQLNNYKQELTINYFAFLFFSFEKVIDWLLEKEELPRTYNLLQDNCQHFAKRLFQTVAKMKKYPNKHKTTSAILESMKLKGNHEEPLE